MIPQQTLSPEQALHLPKAVYEGNELFRKRLSIMFERTCQCKPNNLNCLPPKEWLKSQIGVLGNVGHERINR